MCDGNIAKYLNGIIGMCYVNTMSGRVCDKRMPIMLKAAVYKTVIMPVLMYGSGT